MQSGVRVVAVVVAVSRPSTIPNMRYRICFSCSMSDEFKSGLDIDKCKSGMELEHTQLVFFLVVSK
jgi:hypothetical protein